MSWNYRVMRRSFVHDDGEIEDTFGIYEVYYRDGVVDDTKVSSDEVGYTEDVVGAAAEDLEALKRVLQRMLKACDKPVLDYK